MTGPALTALAVVALSAAPAWGQQPIELADDPARNTWETAEPTPPDADDGFRFLGLVQARYNLTNIVPTSPYLDGQVVGVLGGTNGTEVSAEERSRFGEYRTVGFFNYAPPTFGGRGELTAAFEVDFSFGDQSYLVRGNTGGAFGGDQVNLQTRRLHSTFRPALGGGHSLDIVVGLQFLADGAYNPATATPDDLFRGGGGLKFFGSEAAGVSAYGGWGDSFQQRLRYRLGAYTLYEQGTAIEDDVTLVMVDAEIAPAYGLQLGLHGWLLRDNGDGGGSVFGSGPSSALAELQGAARLDFRPSEGAEAPVVDADLIWLLADAGYNRALTTGPVGVTAFAAANLGKLYVEEQVDPDVRGFATGGELRVRYAPGAGSIARVEGLFTSPNGPEEDVYSGVITGNSYGIVGAVWATHGAVLLFPDVQGINRHVGVVYDVSNKGEGLVGTSGSVGYDIIPNKLTASAGYAWGSTPSGGSLGTEVNGRLIAHPWFLFDVGLVGARVAGSPLEEDPWAVYTYLSWVVF